MGPPHPEAFFDWMQGQWKGALRARMQLKGVVLVASELHMFQLWDNQKKSDGMVKTQATEPKHPKFLKQNLFYFFSKYTGQTHSHLMSFTTS